MKNIRELHTKAMNFARQAERARFEGDAIRSREALEQAFQLEKEAAEDLWAELDAEPTRGILYRSAAYLAFQLEHYYQALQLVDAALAGKPFPEIEAELKSLKQQIDKETKPIEQSPFEFRQSRRALYAFLEKNQNMPYDILLRELNPYIKLQELPEELILEYLSEVQAPKLKKLLKRRFDNSSVDDVVADSILEILGLMRNSHRKNEIYNLKYLIRRFFAYGKIIAFRQLSKATREVKYFRSFLKDVSDTESKDQQEAHERLFVEAIQQLTPQERELIILSKIDRRPKDQIAATLGIPLSEVTKLTYRAFLKLKKYIHKRLQ